MTIISWDVGVKNLAFCIIDHENHNKIEDWDIINLIEDITTDWKDILLFIAEKHKDIINEKINENIKNNIEIVPSVDLIFEAFNKFNFKDLKCIIVGMDPFVNKNEAMGLAFSINPSVIVKCPPSLRNIFKELENEYKIKRTNTDLTDISLQGVLLLNTALTTNLKKTGAHIKIWKGFIADIFDYIANNKKNLTLMAWGNHAKSFSSIFNSNENLILEWTHPSPLSRKPFVGNNHFKLCNDYLIKNKKKTIKWV